MPPELVNRAIELYALAHSEPESDLLRRLREETEATRPDANMLIGPVMGGLLRLLVRLTGAKRALEIGTFTGYSALWVAEGLSDDGRLVTCDIDPEATAVAKRYWAESPCGHRIELRLGDGLESARAVEAPLDFVFMDADKERYPEYYETLLPKLRPGGLFVADNCFWDGDVLLPGKERDEATAAIVRFNGMVRDDPRVEAALLTVRDGVMIARVR